MAAARVVVVDPAAPDGVLLADPAEVLRAGGLVAFPTETVYGLGARADDAAAVGRVFAAKGRPADNPLIVHVADADAVAALAQMTPLATALAARFWPGPLTLVLSPRAPLPAVTTGGLGTVALRVPDHPVALALLRRTGLPIAAPSANRSGRPSPTTASHVLADLSEEVDVVVDGGPGRIGVESTVVDARGDVPVVLREGGVTREELGVVVDADAQASLASPGTRYRHYAPACRVELAPVGEASRRAARLVEGGLRVGLVATTATPPGVTPVAAFTDARDLAALLYGALRAAEVAAVDVVVVEAVPEHGLGRAVMDRLRRAAAG